MKSLKIFQTCLIHHEGCLIYQGKYILQLGSIYISIELEMYDLRKSVASIIQKQAILQHQIYLFVLIVIKVMVGILSFVTISTHGRLIGRYVQSRFLHVLCARMTKYVKNVKESYQPKILCILMPKLGKSVEFSMFYKKKTNARTSILR